MIASGFSWFVLLPGVESGSLLPALGHSMSGWLTAWFVCAGVLTLAAIAGGQLKKAAARDGLEAFEADEGVTLRSFGEVLVGSMKNVVEGALSAEDTRRYLPLIGGLMVYIFSCNVLGLIPGFLPPTDSINANIGMAVVVLITYWAVGLGRDAKGFISHMMGPMLGLAVLMFPLELVGMLLIRPGSLAVRLTGNMFGDHTVFNIMSGLVPLGVPAIFLALGLLVSLIQAFVFGLLTAVYISMSVPHTSHDSEHAH